MKTYIKTVASICIIGFFYTSALTVNPPRNSISSPATSIDSANLANSSKALFMKDIREVVVYPNFAINSQIEGFVVVSFSIDDNGKIHVRETNSNSEILKKHVTETLENFDMSAHANAPREIYNMRFDFKLF